MGVICVVVNASFWWKRSRQPRQAVVAEPLSAPATLSVPLDARIEAEQKEQYLAQNPSDAAVRQDLARLYFIYRNFPKAIEHLLILKEQQPRDAAIRVRLAMAYKQINQLDEALTAVQQALSLSPHNTVAREVLGDIYLAQGRSEDALREFDRCLQQNPKSFNAWMGKARGLEQLYIARRPIATTDIVRPVKEAVKLQPNNPRGLSTLARMTFVYLAQLDEAERLARRAIAIDPSLAEPYLVLVEIFLNKPTPDHLDEAEQLAKKAAELDTSRPEPYYLLGRVQMRRNKVREAVVSLERSMQIESMPETVYMLSLAYARVGEAEKARHYKDIYKRWNAFMEKRKVLLGELQHKPQDVGLYCRLAELYLSTGDLVPAENWLRKAQKLQQNHPRVRALMAQLERHKSPAERSDATSHP
ncbi:MAG: tetratricopeptide repeat protein [Abditibacteriales bacterium]|nr:tetratricopeptide repeat protein [Abditibacteriales bacterium]MDW8364505.1 tetratricopeptide repeat protein [Abditibacteriales bacterium]